MEGVVFESSVVLGGLYGVRGRGENDKREKEMGSISEFIRMYKGVVGSVFKGTTVYVGVHIFGTREYACVLCW